MATLVCKGKETNYRVFFFSLNFHYFFAHIVFLNKKYQNPKIQAVNTNSQNEITYGDWVLGMLFVISSTSS